MIKMIKQQWLILLFVIVFILCFYLILQKYSLSKASFSSTSSLSNRIPTTNKHQGNFNLTILSQQFLSSQQLHKKSQLLQTNLNQTRIVFYKTHKTGSSTISSILWREFCLLDHRNCFLPPKRNPGRMWDFQRSDHRKYASSTLGTNNQPYPYDLWLNHLKYHPYIDVLVPRPRITLTIVRRPSKRFQSAWHWYQLYENSYNISLHQLIQYLSSSSQASSSPHFTQPNQPNQHINIKQLIQTWNFRSGFNSISQELTGFPSNHPSFSSEYSFLLKQILSFEVYVLITDRFSESLLILWTLFAWNHSNNSPFNNILPNHFIHTSSQYLNTTKQNIEINQTFTKITYLPLKTQIYPHDLTEQELFQLDISQEYDYLLYQLANQALNRLIDCLYPQISIFNELLQQYSQELENIRQLCQSQSSSSSSTSLMYSCELLAMDNQDFVHLFWKQHKHNQHQPT